MELPGDSAGFRHVSMILREEVAQLGNGAIAIVARDFQQDAGPAWAIGFQVELFIHHAGQLARASLNGFLQRIAGHVGFFGLQDRQPEPGIAIRIRAGASRDRDLADNARENLPALNIHGTLVPFNRRPMAMSTHIHSLQPDSEGPTAQEGEVDR